MDDIGHDRAPGPLSRKDLQWLRDLVAAMQQPQPERGDYLGEDQLRSGAYPMSTLSSAQVQHAAMLWMYDTNRVFWFDWRGWRRGWRLLGNWSDHTADSLDHLTVRKLITAVARDDRWSEDAWEDFFKRGQGQQLFARLLELEEDLARTGASSRLRP